MSDLSGKEVSIFGRLAVLYAWAVAIVCQDTNNKPRPLLVNPDGSLASGEGYGVTNVSSAALEASHVLKASAGSLVSLRGYNSGGAQFIQLHNAAALPANGAIPLVVMAVPATSNFEIPLPVPLVFATGIVVCNSSTAPTKTIGGADCFFTAQIK